MHMLEQAGQKQPQVGARTFPILLPQYPRRMGMQDILARMMEPRMEVATWGAGSGVSSSVIAIGRVYAAPCGTRRCNACICHVPCMDDTLQHVRRPYGTVITG